MKMDKVAGSKNDEFYTPKYAIEPILKYIDKSKTIWCPFDNENSWFVKMFIENGNKVIYSHIDDNKDFLNYEPQEEYDYIISNPPYSIKAEVLERCFELNKPFALLLGVVGIFESKRRFNMFKENNFEIMYLNKRVAYFKNYEEQKPSLNPPFSSVYICKNILPNRIVFEEIYK